MGLVDPKTYSNILSWKCKIIEWLSYTTQKRFSFHCPLNNLFVSRPTFICMTASLNCHNRKAHLDGFDSIMTEFLKISIQIKLDLRTAIFLKSIFLNWNWNWICNDLIWRKISVNKSENGLHKNVLCRWTCKLKYFLNRELSVLISQMPKAEMGLGNFI